VVVVSLCSLRADHVGAYGSALRTPAMDRVAAAGTRFERAYAASPFTLASLTAVLTGRFPSTTGVLSWGQGLGETTTLPEVLGLYGYATGAFTVDAASGLRPEYGLDRGFQRMSVVEPPAGTPDGRSADDPGTPGATAAELVAWIEAASTARPLFALLHSRSAHYPFVVSPEGADADPTGVTRALWEEGRGTATEELPGRAGGRAKRHAVRQREDPVKTAMDAAGDAGWPVWKAAYAAAVERTDHDVAAVLDVLERTGRSDRTVVVVVGDHGESLGEQDELLHGDGDFEGVARVPLIVAVPGVAPSVSSGLVSHVDLLPTVLELVGAAPPAGIDGVSAAPLIAGEAQVRGTVLVEGGVGARRDDATPRGAVITPRWSLLRQDWGCGGAERPRPGGPPPKARTCLYDLQADPRQAHDVADEHPEVVEDLLARWDGFREARAGSSVAEELRLDPEFVALLQASGYDFRADP